LWLSPWQRKEPGDPVTGLAVLTVTSTVREETGRMQDLMDWILEAIRRKRSRGHDKPSSRVM
jgi:hypothetical protein